MISSQESIGSRMLRWLVVLGCASLAVAPAETASAMQADNAAGPAPLSIALEGGDAWRNPTDALVIQLNRPIEVEDGRVAVLIGTLDLSDLVVLDEQQLVYEPHVLPLPVGENELTVFRVSPTGEWSQIGSTTLRVERPGGLRTLERSFSADIQGIAQFETGGTPDDQAPPTFENATGQFAARGKLIHRDYRLTGSLNVFGASEAEQALQFGQRGDDAEQLDLAAYALRFERGSLFAQLGHTNYGAHRHLVSSFSSRGLSLGATVGRAELRFAALNGSSLVGWSNPLGLADSNHQVLSGGVGIEVLPNRPGGLRLDFDFLDGSRLPLSGFNEGLINDREENDAWGAQLAASLPNGRLNLQAGFAESDFTNPTDPLLAQGSDLVEVRGETRNARFGQLDVGLIRERPMGERFTTNLDLSIRHERVDPQYRTVGAFVAADIEQNGADLSLGLGPVQVLLGVLRSRDNLDDIPSILETKTRVRNANLLFPFSALQNEPSPWLPVLSYSYNRTHQFAGNQPINSGFNATSHLPDQVSLNHTVSLDWQGNQWTLGYFFNDSDQDNRQPGRELADFTNASHGLRLTLTPVSALDLGIELSRDRARSIADDRTDRNERLGLNLLWRPLDAMSVSALASWTEAEDDPATFLSDSFVANLEWAYRMTWREQARHGGSGQVFLRYGVQDFESEDAVFGFFEARDEWTISAGFNLSLR